MAYLKSLSLIILVNLTLILNAQINYYEIEYKELTPMQIDTLAEPILIIHKRYATIYLKQADILQYIELNKRSWSNKFTNITGLLSTKNKRLIISDWWYDYDGEDREKMFGDKNYENQNRYYLKELYDIVANLIHDGKFMVRDKNRSSMIVDKLCIKKTEGFYGTEYATFLLPNGKSFWTIITALGE